MSDNIAGQGPHERPVGPLHDEAQQDFQDALEVAFWGFDARRKGYGRWAGAPQSERDAFKAECASIACAYFDAKNVPLGFKMVPL